MRCTEVVRVLPAVPLAGPPDRRTAVDGVPRGRRRPRGLHGVPRTPIVLTVPHPASPGRGRDRPSDLGPGATMDLATGRPARDRSGPDLRRHRTVLHQGQARRRTGRRPVVRSRLPGGHRPVPLRRPATRQARPRQADRPARRAWTRLRTTGQRTRAAPLRRTVERGHGRPRPAVPAPRPGSHRRPGRRRLRPREAHPRSRRPALAHADTRLLARRPTPERGGPGRMADPRLPLGRTEARRVRRGPDQSVLAAALAAAASALLVLLQVGQDVGAGGVDDVLGLVQQPGDAVVLAQARRRRRGGRGRPGSRPARRCRTGGCSRAVVRALPGASGARSRSHLRTVSRCRRSDSRSACSRPASACPPS